MSAAAKRRSHSFVGDHLTDMGFTLPAVDRLSLAKQQESSMCYININFQAPLLLCDLSIQINRKLKRKETKKRNALSP